MKKIKGQVIYISENGGLYTEERFKDEIKLCMLQMEEFKTLNDEQFNKALNFAYNRILVAIVQDCPSSYFDQFKEEDIKEILEHAMEG